MPLKKAELMILTNALTGVRNLNQSVLNDLNRLVGKVEEKPELEIVRDDVLELADVLRYGADQLVKSVIPAHKTGTELPDRIASKLQG